MTSMVGIVDRRLARRLAVGRAWRVLLHGLAIPRRAGVADMLFSSYAANGCRRGVRSGIGGAGCLATGQLGEGMSFAQLLLLHGAATDADRAGGGRADSANKSDRCSLRARRR